MIFLDCLRKQKLQKILLHLWVPHLQCLLMLELGPKLYLFNAATYWPSSTAWSKLDIGLTLRDFKLNWFLARMLMNCIFIYVLYIFFIVKADDKSQVGSRKEEAVVPLSLLYQKELAAGLFNALLNCWKTWLWRVPTKVVRRAAGFYLTWHFCFYSESTLSLWRAKSGLDLQICSYNKQHMKPLTFCPFDM